MTDGHFLEAVVNCRDSVFTAELERQTRDDEGREKVRQKTLAGAPKGDSFVLGRFEGLSSAGVSATSYLQGVTTGFEGNLYRVVHVQCSGVLTIDLDVVGAPSDLDSDGLMGQLQD
jgi:hypothetical protein